MEARSFLYLAFVAIQPVDASQEPGFDVVWSVPEQLERKLPPARRRAVEEEVLAVYREVGIAVRFVELSSSENGATPAFHVILVDRSGTGFGLTGQAMGAILEKDPARRTVYVFLPAILKSLRHPVADDSKMIHDVRKGQVLARALGRVVAHEIAHAVDRDLPHGPEDSLMSELLTPRMLQQYRLNFDERTAERLRARIRHMTKNDSFPLPDCGRSLSHERVLEELSRGELQ